MQIAPLFVQHFFVRCCCSWCGVHGHSRRTWKRNIVQSEPAKVMTPSNKHKGREPFEYGYFRLLAGPYLCSSDVISGLPHSHDRWYMRLTVYSGGSIVYLAVDINCKPITVQMDGGAFFASLCRPIAATHERDTLPSDTAANCVNRHHFHERTQRALMLRTHLINKSGRPADVSGRSSRPLVLYANR